MIAPINIPCPACGEPAGSYCTSPTTNPKVRQGVTFHHAERIDAAFGARTPRHSDPRALRDALREALRLLESRLPADVLDRAVIENEPERAARDRAELSFIITCREDFQL